MISNRLCPSLATIFLLMGGGCKDPGVNHHDAARLLRALATETRIWWFEVREPLLARVENHRITQSDFRDAYRSYAQSNPKWLADQDGARRLLNMIISQEIPAELAEKRRLDHEQAYYQQMMLARREVLTRLLRERLEAEQPITEENVKALYRSEFPEAPPPRALTKGQTIKPRMVQRPSYESVRESLRQRLSQERWNRMLTETRKAIKVSFHDKGIGSVVPVSRSRSED